MTSDGGTYDMNVGNKNGNELAEEEIDSRIMTDRGEKFKLRKDPPASFWSKVSTQFGFYSIDGTDKMFVFLYVMCAFCSVKYRDVSLYNCLAEWLYRDIFIIMGYVSLIVLYCDLL